MLEPMDQPVIAGEIRGHSARISGVHGDPFFFQLIRKGISE